METFSIASSMVDSAVSVPVVDESDVVTSETALSEVSSERPPPAMPPERPVAVVEIVSPGSRGTDHVMKVHEYAKAGIANYWIVDPDAPADERFLAYRLEAGTYRRVAALEGDRVRVNEPTALEFVLDVLTGR